MAPLPFLRFLFHTHDGFSSLSPRDAGQALSPVSKRSITTPTYPQGQGSSSPESFNNAGFLALFALIGAGMVLGSIWFFFWAKNGGFVFHEGDWEDYKSTVLRRKGPDGRTLSYATRSTKLGGGSSIAGTQEYKWARAAAKSVVSRDEKGRKGILGKRGWGGSHSVTYSDDWQSRATRTVTSANDTMTIAEEMTERRLDHGRHQHHSHNHNDDDTVSESTHLHASRYRDRDRDVTEYKRERPARVGGLNRVADGSHFGTTITDGSEVSGSEATSAAEDRRAKHKERERERAERRAREEAAKMERRWRKEAEEAAAALARESTTVKTPAPPTKPRNAHGYTHIHSSAPAPPSAASDEYGSSGMSGSNRSPSYYDSYRPRQASGPRQPSPKKSTRPGGYRRGADSELD